ncbi:FkbM family methyltransferase (plasmid) [Natrinema zhouii]|uniref:FkbM family methyltransferase n=1 Tax=Natrinema zhouii TaxID=1710539 RepID=UPI001CFFB011|nr:FkbM family methyltransferase [Natrinema zhouii]UHQ98826.1 FkbM family methyltransferase [Natrinema zhouii]
MDRDEEQPSDEPVQTTISGVDVQFRVASERERRFLPDDVGIYDEMFEDMFSEMHGDDVFFDIGAHIGINSCVIGRRHPEIDIVCFEPHPQTRRSLETNLELNEIDALVMDCAISNSDGAIAFDTQHDTPGGMGEVRHSGQGIETPVRTLDSIIKDDGVPSPTVIMSDIVGEEINLLRGGSMTFSSLTTRLAYLVTHDQPLERLGSSKHEVEDLLRSYGFDELEYLRDNFLKAKKSSQSG